MSPPGVGACVPGWDPSGCSSWLWDGATPPHPLTPGSGACLLESGSVRLPQPAAWNAGGPCNEQLSHPKEKQAHLQKPRGARRGLGTGCEGGASWSAFLLSRVGSRASGARGPSPSRLRASVGPPGRAGWEAPGGRKLWGHCAAQRTGWERALCRESRDPSTRAPQTSEHPGALKGSPPPRPQFPPLSSCACPWPGMLSGG